MERLAIRTLVNAEEKSIRAIDNLLTRLRHFRRTAKHTQARLDWVAVRESVLKLDFKSPILDKYSCIFSLPYYEDGKLWLGKESPKLYPPNTIATHVREHDLNGIYRIIRQNDIVRLHFQKSSLSLEFPAISDCCITLYCYQSILAGAIGEEAIKALLDAKGIELERVPDPLFEMIDMKVLAHSWYIDCKNYTERTMDNFSLGADDPAWHFKLNEESFKHHAVRKLAAIREYHSDQSDCKLIYLNLAGNTDRLMGYFTLAQSGFQGGEGKGGKIEGNQDGGRARC